MKNFRETFKEIKDGAKDKKVTFSKTDFDVLAKAYLNDPKYEAVVYSKDKGEQKLETVKAVRGSIKRILKDFGVDAQEAEKIMTDYEIKSVDGVYEMCSELIYKYLEAGKKFTFMSKPNFEASLTLEEVGHSKSTTKGIGDGAQEYVVEKQKHQKLKVKSGCPDWLKTSKKK